MISAFLSLSTEQLFHCRTQSGWLSVIYSLKMYFLSPEIFLPFMCLEIASIIMDPLHNFPREWIMIACIQMQEKSRQDEFRMKECVQKQKGDGGENAR